MTVADLIERLKQFPPHARVARGEPTDVEGRDLFYLVDRFDIYEADLRMFRKAPPRGQVAYVRSTTCGNHEPPERMVIL